MTNKIIEGGNKDDTGFMTLALEEAQKGIGRTSPNPHVGCVIVLNGEIVGRGFHKRAGTPHAEIHALKDAGDRACGATAYVTLEPCSHTGRTGPCCVALYEAGVKRVVIGMMDPNPLVNGGGAEFLLSKGVEVCCKVLEAECVALNRAFIKKISTGLPFMIMKAGVSLDGRLNYQVGMPGWITGPQSSEYVHRLRNQVDAIMVGRGTIEIDNPSLTTRLPGIEVRNPQPIILDSRLQISLSAKVFTREDELLPIIICQRGLAQYHKEAFVNKAILIEVERMGTGLDLQEMMRKLGEHHINSVLVEGGAQLHGALLKAKIYDYAYLFQAPIFAGDKGVALIEGVGGGSREDAVQISSPQYEQLGDDMLLQGEMQYPS